MKAEQATLASRLTALDRVVDLSRGRVPDEVLAPADALIDRAGQRLAIAGDHTVVALAGATGSGKSSLFNALSETEFAKPGVTRPTTSEAMAVAWGTQAPTRLLDWLQVGGRHVIPPRSTVPDGLVLLDLPDHDSTEAAHRVTVDRLVKVVDMLVWVVDPQKYADSALHDGYLKPLAGHAALMVVALNQVDRLNPEQRRATMADLRRLLDSEGLAATRLVAVSALRGEGLGPLRELIADAARDKEITARRFAADIAREAALVGEALGSGPVPTLSRGDVSALHASVAEASGVPVVTEGVLQAWRHRGTLATGWPLITWLRRLRPDPLRRLRIDRGPGPTEVARTSLPKATPVQRARLDAALRQVIELSTMGLPRGWADRIKAAARSDRGVLADRIDAAIGATDLRMNSGHGWWSVVTVLQWLGIVAVLVGGGWLLAPLVLAVLQAPVEVPMLVWQGWPLPTLLVLGGVGIGVVFGLLSRVFVEAGARVKQRQAAQALTASVASVVDTEVIDPIRAELTRLAEARAAVERAR
ncbi:MAG TPA: 50S ribosome-binding GTPase [Propioniciclava sp.]|uniref:GTPase n=1 Tax=Propioniciclava sp. TaxID=2038686 RepID=UPI002BC4E880|nr:GTPase [Propioniciclava sp.]HRL50041.1 50S ribosome-binding GTPase [Propioniciclava sp.]HRL80387.1 50S ribosome-binding GTPase [Propioniciclava sp.]